jgi:hypothetical protein
MAQHVIPRIPVYVGTHYMCTNYKRVAEAAEMFQWIVETLDEQKIRTDANDSKYKIKASIDSIRFHVYIYKGKTTGGYRVERSDSHLTVEVVQRTGDRFQFSEIFKEFFARFYKRWGCTCGTLMNGNNPQEPDQDPE